MAGANTSSGGRRWSRKGSATAASPCGHPHVEPRPGSTTTAASPSGHPHVNPRAGSTTTAAAHPKSFGVLRCALVTGSNKGIGFEICRLLLQEGIQVIVTARDQGRGQQAAAKLRAGPGGVGLLGFVCLDVRDEPSIAQLPAAVKELLPHGHLDILVNNAGVAYPDSHFGIEEARTIVDINTLGTIRVTRALLPLLAAAPSGRVVNVSSGTSGSLGKAVAPSLRQQFLDPNLTDAHVFALLDDFVESVGSGKHKERGWLGTMYDVTKLAQIAFSVALARQLSTQGTRISVTCYCPGFCKTDMCDSCYGPGSGKISAAQGADTAVWLALLPDQESLASSGYFFRRRRVVQGYFW